MAPIPDVRALTPNERRLLEWLLKNGTPDAAAYLPQLDTVSVVSRCGCGCPTIDLAVNGRVAAPGGSDILADMTGLSPEGIKVGVLVHARAGLLAELEVYDVVGVSQTFTLPEIEKLV